MRPNAKALALRDPALAVLMGAISGDDFGSDFGGEFGDDDYGSYGFEFGLDIPLVPGSATAPTAGAQQMASFLARGLPAQLGIQKAATGSAGSSIMSVPAVQQLVAQAQDTHQATRTRTRMLQPNQNSTVKVERYVFSINQALTLGTVSPINATGQPDTNIRPQRVTMNAPSYGFATIEEIKVANVSVSVGGVQDAFDYNSLGVGQSLDMPTLSPANRATVLGDYTGFVPPGFTGGTPYNFCISFKGPASITA